MPPASGWPATSKPMGPQSPSLRALAERRVASAGYECPRQIPAAASGSPSRRRCGLHLWLLFDNRGCRSADSTAGVEGRAEQCQGVETVQCTGEGELMAEVADLALRDHEYEHNGGPLDRPAHLREEGQDQQHQRERRDHKGPVDGVHDDAEYLGEGRCPALHDRLVEYPATVDPLHEPGNRPDHNHGLNSHFGGHDVCEHLVRISHDIPSSWGHVEWLD